MLRALRPAVLLRREASPVPELGKSLVWSTSALLVAGFAVVSFHLLGALRPAVAFTITLVVSVLRIVFLTRLALWIAAAIRPRNATLRIACGNLVRPGNGAAMLIATLSAGVMMMTGTVTSSRVVIQAVEARLPFDLENSVALTGFDNAYRESIVTFAAALPGVERLETKSEARLRLPSEGDGLYIAACAHGLAINREMADRLGVQPGSRMIFFAGNREFAATVSAISPFSRQMEVDCSAIDAKDLLYQDVVHARPGRLPEVEAALRSRFPALAVITGTELSAVVAGLSRDAQRLAACVGGYSLAVGLAILITLVASSRRRRLREIAVLSTLGATPNSLACIFTIEFAAIGAIAGLIGTTMACGFGSLLLGLIFHRWELSVEWTTALGAILLSAVLVTAAGWLPTYRLLRQKPAVIFRRH
jgi:putative ABC transport system permease protein